MKITLVLADDHELMRKGLRALLEEQADFEVVGEAANGHEAVQLARKFKPDVVLMDLAMPELNGLEATRQILHTHPKARIVALTLHADVRMVDRSFRAGIRGYLLKEAAFDELEQAIRTVLKGETYLSKQIGREQLENVRKASAAGSLLETLSTREREVLQLMAEGFATTAIADKLLISPKTVETHRKTLMTKLSLQGLAEVTKFALREGLITLG